MAKKDFNIIPAVYLILIKENKILLSRRYHTGFCDGKYGFPAGHINENEGLIQAIVREAKEEIGIGVNPEDLRLIHVLQRHDPYREWMDFFFTTDIWKGEPKNMEPHKCNDLSWFELNNLPNNVIFYIKQAIDSFQSNKPYSEYGFW